MVSGPDGTIRRAPRNEDELSEKRLNVRLGFSSGAVGLDRRIQLRLELVDRILETLAFFDDTMLQHHEWNLGVPCGVGHGGELFRVNEIRRRDSHISALVQKRLQDFVKRRRCCWDGSRCHPNR